MGAARATRGKRAVARAKAFIVQVLGNRRVVKGYGQSNVKEQKRGWPRVQVGSSITDVDTDLPLAGLCSREHADITSYDLLRQVLALAEVQAAASEQLFRSIE